MADFVSRMLRGEGPYRATTSFGLSARAIRERMAFLSALPESSFARITPGSAGTSNTRGSGAIDYNALVSSLFGSGQSDMIDPLRGTDGAPVVGSAAAVNMFGSATAPAARPKQKGGMVSSRIF